MIELYTVKAERARYGLFIRGFLRELFTAEQLPLALGRLYMWRQKCSDVVLDDFGAEENP